MKRIVYSLLAAVMLTACGDEEEAPSVPKQGQYIAVEGNITAAVYVGAQVSITIYKDGKYTYQDSHGSQSGSWPTYTYAFDDKGAVVLRCTYSDPQNFTASTSAGILPATLHFRYDSRVLDANGDGVLDD